MTREGDHLITPFECYLCIFVKLKNRDPIAQSEEDKKMASCIRKTNLDAFWSRSLTTVTKNLRLVMNLAHLPKTVGLNSPFPNHGPFLNSYHCGYQIATSMLLMSTKPGRHDKSYT